MSFFSPSPRLLPLLRLRANTDGAIDDDDVQLQALELELLTLKGGIRWLTCFLIRFLMDALESDLYMCIYMYIYIITYTEKQCIQHIHVYTMIVRIYNMIYVYYYVSYIDSRFTKQNCVGKGKLALMVCRQC
jgi:hypothetical protein